MKKKNIKNYLLLFFIGAFFITLTSKNSFLYRINDWWDANAFLTVGKAMMKGSVPYLDLFEQKGPLLYLIYGIASLVSDTSFIGVYFLELLAFFVVLVYAQKILLLFDDKNSLPALILLSMGIVILKPFSHGGSAEEFTLPLFMISAYYFTKYLRDESYTLNYKLIFLNGLIAGCVLWIKYTLLGFWFIFEAFLFFSFFFQKKYKKAFISAILFLSGMAVATIPWIVYFGMYHAIGNLFEVYFFVNMTAYAKKTSLLVKILKALAIFAYNLIRHPAFLLFITLPTFVLLFKKYSWGRKYSNFVLVVALFFTGFAAFIGGTNYFYYAFILAPFEMIGILFCLLIWKEKKIVFQVKHTIALFIFCAILTFLLSENTSMIFKKKGDYAQFVFASVIKESKDTSLLNYHFLDGGFYTTTDITPHYYYFMRNNIPKKNYPILYEEQDRYIREEKPMFVVTKKKWPILDTDYIIIKEKTQNYEKKKQTYYLYKRKNSES